MSKRFLTIALAYLCLISIASSVFAQDNKLQSNKKIAMQAIKLWLSGTDIDPTTIYAPNYVNHLDSATNLSGGPQKRNLEEFKAEVAKFHTAFADVKLLNSMQVAEGNLVSTRVELSAKHIGSFLGEAPTKETITYDAVEFVKIENGKILETWVTWDKYGFLKQIGAFK
ncbi:ester cyclase [Microbulbifer epialgicus]|uniref:Ester cyclase n=1 Tax=Microbulbifer epialgicus TaxID=393907 RepID=A0ABV4P4Y3_9GAMM